MGTITFGDNASDIRTALGLGTAATATVGTGANNVVQLDGSGNLPAIDGSALTGLSGAKIKQIVESSTHTQYSFTNTGFADDSATTVNITPSSTSHRILLLWSDGTYNGANSSAVQIRIMRDGSTNVLQSQYYQIETNFGAIMWPMSIAVSDVPATTSQVTYTLQFRQQVGTTSYLSYNNSKRSLIAIEYEPV